MTQHLNFVRTCEAFALLSLGFAIVYYFVGHLPTLKALVIQMEEFRDEPQKAIEGGLQLTERSSVENPDSETNRYNGDHKQVFNDTVETLDDETV